MDNFEEIFGSSDTLTTSSQKTTIDDDLVQLLSGNDNESSKDYFEELFQDLQIKDGHREEEPSMLETSPPKSQDPRGKNKLGELSVPFHTNYKTTPNIVDTTDISLMDTAVHSSHISGESNNNNNTNSEISNIISNAVQEVDDHRKYDKPPIPQSPQLHQPTTQEEEVLSDSEEKRGDKICRVAEKKKSFGNLLKENLKKKIQDGKTKDTKQQSTDLKKKLFKSSAPKLSKEEEEVTSKEEKKDATKHRTTTKALQEMAFKVHTLKEASNEKYRTILRLLTQLFDRNLSESDKSRIELEITTWEQQILHDDVLIESLELNIDSILRRDQSNDQLVTNNASEFVYPPKEKNPNPRSVVIVEKFEDLPAKVQTKIKDECGADDEMSGNFEIVLKLINFIQHAAFYTSHEERIYSLIKKLKVKPPKYGRIIKPFGYFAANASPLAPAKLYKQFKYLGSAGFGRVSFAKDKKKGDRVAIKKIKCDSERAFRYAAKEISYLQFCKHKNIVNYVDLHYENNLAWIIMEFMDGKNAAQIVDSVVLDERYIACITEQVLNGLKYLHGNEIIHCNIKASNIMLNTSGEVKLIDLSLCEDLREINFMSKFRLRGTAYYIPPEAIINGEYSPAYDIWSLGISLLEIANGSLPFNNPAKTMYSACTNTVGPLCSLLKNPGKWSDSFISFIEQCLEFDPSRRPTAEMLLNNDWFKMKCTELELSTFVKNHVKQCATF